MYYWIQGFVIATLLAWFGLRGFISETSNPKWNEVAKDYLEPGKRYCRGEEGYGWVDFSNNGILGGKDGLSKDDRHVVFWGDSFVEAYQVTPSATCYSLFTQITSDAGQDNYQGVAVAKSGRDLGHHIELLALYEDQIPNCKANLVLFDYADITPNGRSLIIDGEPVWKHAVAKPSMLSARQIIADYQLDVFWILAKRTISAVKGLRLRPGPVAPAVPSTSGNDVKYTQDELVQFWQKLADGLVDQEARSGRIIMIFHPRVPQLIDGELSTEVADREHVTQFMQICNDRGLETVDLTDDFVDYYNETGLFVHGFSNTFPSRGHWNVNGHRVVATTAWNYLQTHPEKPRHRDQPRSATQ
ncbi:MAG: hypothetical protein AAFN77_17055 [Planctomycetota bacterium]